MNISEGINMKFKFAALQMPVKDSEDENLETVGRYF